MCWCVNQVLQLFCLYVSVFKPGPTVVLCLSACFSICHVYGTKPSMCNSPLVCLPACFSMYHVHRMKPFMCNSPLISVSACFSMCRVYGTKPSVCVYNRPRISVSACFSMCHARGTKPSACGTPGRCHAASASPPPRLTRRACACRWPRKQGDGVADRAACRMESISRGGRWESAG